MRRFKAAGGMASIIKCLKEQLPNDLVILLLCWKLASIEFWTKNNYKVLSFKSERQLHPPSGFHIEFQDRGVHDGWASLQRQVITCCGALPVSPIFEERPQLIPHIICYSLL